MAIKLLKTLDQSNTLYVEELDETYHSRNGALEESKHVFIKAGLHEKAGQKKKIDLLEVGFGTGLNAILTYTEARELGLTIHYHTLETFPLSHEIMNSLQYTAFIPEQDIPSFGLMHKSPWNEEHKISDHFFLHKHLCKLEDFVPAQQFDLIYFDAFAPDKQPELWTIDQFSKLYLCLRSGGIMVTYSSKGEVKRNLRQIGFNVERLPGPPFKRHMLRAVKP